RRGRLIMDQRQAEVTETNTPLIGRVMAELFDKLGWMNRVLALVAYLVIAVADGRIPPHRPAVRGQIEKARHDQNGRRRGVSGEEKQPAIKRTDREIQADNIQQSERFLLLYA